MSVLDDIQSRIDVRMSEINRRVGCGATPCAQTGTGLREFDPAETIRAVRGMASMRGTCRRMGLCVGLPEVDPSAYGGSSQPCPGCDLDASDFANVLSAAGIETTLLLNADATRAGVLDAMRRAAGSLRDGDLFVMTVAGHGARGKGGDGRTHECWCLWDGKLQDSDIVGAVKAFSPGVRIVMINDQCHSGGIFVESCRGSSGTGVLRELFGRGAGTPMLIQFAACRAEESSIGYPIGGTWMTALMKVLAVDKEISWQAWFEKASVHPSLTEAQRPQWVEMGPVSDGFRSGRVFI